MSRAKSTTVRPPVQPPTASLSLDNLRITLADHPAGPKNECVISGKDLAMVLGMIYERTTRHMITGRLHLDGITRPEGIASDLRGLADIFRMIGVSDEPMGGEAAFLLQDVALDLSARAEADHLAEWVAETARVEIIQSTTGIEAPKGGAA